MSTVSGSVTVGGVQFPVTADITLPGPGTGPFLPYTADSYYKSLASSQAVDETLTASFRAFMAGPAAGLGQTLAYPQLNGIGGSLWGMPYALGAATDPVWILKGPLNSETAILGTQGFHAPSWLGSVLTGTSDSPFEVIDTANGYTAIAEKCTLVSVPTATAPGVISTQGPGGIMYHTSNGLDSRNPASDDQRNWTSRGRISEAIVIRRDLVDYAIANNTGLGHVLHMYFVETDSSKGFMSPMVGFEGSKNGWGAEGQRLAIDPAIDLTTRGLSPGGLAIARTLQQHGCYLGDNSGSGSAFHAEQENPGHPVWGGVLTRNSLSGITWNDFVALQPV